MEPPVDLNMKIKQVIATVHSPQGNSRIVLDDEGNCIVGDEQKLASLLSPEAKLTVGVRGTEGEAVRATVNDEGACLNGNKEAVAQVLANYPHTLGDLFQHVALATFDNIGEEASDFDNLDDIETWDVIDE